MTAESGILGICLGPYLKNRFLQIFRLKEDGLLVIDCLISNLGKRTVKAKMFFFWPQPLLYKKDQERLSQA